MFQKRNGGMAEAGTTCGKQSQSIERWIALEDPKIGWEREVSMLHLLSRQISDVQWATSGPVPCSTLKLCPFHQKFSLHRSMGIQDNDIFQTFLHPDARLGFHPLFSRDCSSSGCTMIQAVSSTHASAPDSAWMFTNSPVGH